MTRTEADLQTEGVNWRNMQWCIHAVPLSGSLGLRAFAHAQMPSRVHGMSNMPPHVHGTYGRPVTQLDRKSQLMPSSSTALTSAQQNEVQCWCDHITPLPELLFLEWAGAALHVQRDALWMHRLGNSSRIAHLLLFPLLFQDKIRLGWKIWGAYYV